MALPVDLDPGLRVSMSDSIKRDQGLISETPTDSVGDPDFSVMAEGLAARRELENVSLPSRADIFLSPSALALPRDFSEPPAYFLNAHEWTVYSDRRDRIDARIEEALLGTHAG